MGKKSKLPDLPLEGSMQLKNVLVTKNISSSILVWSLKNYDKLKCGILYFQMYESKSFKCIFKLFISRNRRLHLAVRCGYYSAYSRFYVFNGVNNPSTKIARGREIADGLYVAEFVDNFLLCKDSVCSEIGQLTIAFKITTDYTTERQYSPSTDIILLCDTDVFCHNLQSSYVNSVDQNFTINVVGTSMKAHKCVLYARSEFFKEYFDEVEEAKEFSVPDTVPGIMHEVLLYMYSGELSDLDAKCTIKVLEVAYLLKIPSLKERCLRFLEETDLWEAIEGVKFFEYKICE